MPFCMLLPRHRFSGSIFNTPLLLILRLFYQASSFDLSNPQAGSDHSHPRILPCHACGVPLDKERTSMPLTVREKDNKIPGLFGHYEILSTTDWFHRLSANPSMYVTLQVVSMTWVKGLASPLSHEFVQFVVEDTTRRTRYRLVADRHENGDWVIVGWDWASGKSPLDRHSLPLPLVSLTFNDVRSRPNVFSIGKVLADVTASRPSYNIMKEMCWWYAEAVFEAAHAKFGGELKEWKWSRFRYSFIVRTNVLRRETLASEAEEFEKQNAEDMSF